jgi:hypothetical protein
MPRPVFYCRRVKFYESSIMTLQNVQTFEISIDNVTNAALDW